MAHSLTAVFVGSDTLLMQCVQAWLEKGHGCLAVATDADKVRRFCADNGLRCLDATGDWAAGVAGERIDHVFAITWLRLLPDAVLRLPQRAAINFHDGPLPRYAGLNATCCCSGASRSPPTTPPSRSTRAASRPASRPSPN